MTILGYVTCTTPECKNAAEVVRCNGKRSKFLMLRCSECGTDQRSSAKFQAYLATHKPMNEWEAEHVQTEPALEPLSEVLPSSSDEPPAQSDSLVKPVLIVGALGLFFGGVIRAVRSAM